MSRLTDVSQGHLGLSSGPLTSAKATDRLKASHPSHHVYGRLGHACGHRFVLLKQEGGRSCCFSHLAVSGSARTTPQVTTHRVTAVTPTGTGVTAVCAGQGRLSDRVTAARLPETHLGQGRRRSYNMTSYSGESSNGLTVPTLRQPHAR
jgi:hypothetical protein